MVTLWAVSAIERGDEVRWSEPSNDSAVMISIDPRGVVRNLRVSVRVNDRGQRTRDHHHRGVVLTGRYGVW